MTPFFDVTAVKSKITRRRRYVISYTTYALDTRDFYPVLGEITWSRYKLSVQVKHADILIRCARKDTDISISNPRSYLGIFGFTADGVVPLGGHSTSPIYHYSADYILWSFGISEFIRNLYKIDFS